MPRLRRARATFVATCSSGRRPVPRAAPCSTLTCRMKFSLLLAGFLLVFASAAYAQPISGRITNAQTREPLPYVNVGVVGKALGTVANEQGAYQLTYQEALAGETVRVSSVGYAPRNLTLRELLVQPNVALTPEAVVLNEVRVKGKALFRRTHTLGNTSNAEVTTLTLDNRNLGGQVGTVIKLSRRPTRVLKAAFNIAHPNPGMVTFRVNLYRLDAKGRPTDTKLLARDVIVTSPVVKGPLVVDLSADQLVLDEDFFLAIEMIKWVGAAERGTEFAFSASVGYFNNEIYERKLSQATWERASVGALLAGMQPRLSFYVTVND